MICIRDQISNLVNNCGERRQGKEFKRRLLRIISINLPVSWINRVQANQANNSH